MKKIARSALSFGGNIFENSEIISLKNKQEFWSALVTKENKEKKEIKAKYIINCLGPWSNYFLEKNGIKPTHLGLNNKGSHLVLGVRAY